MQGPGEQSELRDLVMGFRMRVHKPTGAKIRGVVGLSGSPPCSCFVPAFLGIVLGFYPRAWICAKFGFLVDLILHTSVVPGFWPIIADGVLDLPRSGWAGGFGVRY